MNLKKQKTMKREIITIDEYGRLDIPTDTAAIWMTEAEIVELFGTTAGAVNSAIKAIIKSDALHDYDVCKRIRLDNDNSADVYNMEVVVALAFRLNTYPASGCGGSLYQPLSENRRRTPPIVIRYKDGLPN